MDEVSRATFHDLLASEIQLVSGKNVHRSETVCKDEPCACAAGEKLAAKRVVLTSASKLGSKWIVTSRVIAVGECKVLNSGRVSVTGLEDLEEASNKIARMLVEGKTLAQATEVGNVTAKDQKRDRLRKGNDGLSLRVGGVFPVASFDNTFGVMWDLGYWFEGQDFAIEPRMGYQFNADEKGAEYGVFKLDAAGHYILSRGDFAPMVGGGLGIRHISQERQRDFSVGNIFSIEGDGTVHESTWAPGLFVRGGLILMRTYETRIALTVDYDMTFAESHGDAFSQTLNVGVAVIF
jgi:hypothetical protein